MVKARKERRPVLKGLPTMIRITVHLQKEELPSIDAVTHFAGEEREFTTVDIGSQGQELTLFVYTLSQAEALRDAFAKVAANLQPKPAPSDSIAELDAELDAAAEELKELKLLEYCNRTGASYDSAKATRFQEPAEKPYSDPYAGRKHGEDSIDGPLYCVNCSERISPQDPVIVERSEGWYHEGCAPGTPAGGSRADSPLLGFFGAVTAAG